MKGVGADTKSASVISFKDEDLFWETGAVGFETPRSLHILVCYYVGLHFCLQGGQEQRDLSFQQLSRIPPDRDVYDEDTYYEYAEYVSKTIYTDLDIFTPRTNL